MKRFRGTLLLACSIIIILLFTPLATVEAAAGWIVVPSANPGTTNVLNSVSWQQWTKVGWAVGSFQKTGGPAQTLTETWNGSAWITVSSPNMGLADALNGVTSVIGTPDFWAVGYWINGAGVKQTLTEQYTGGSWNIIPSPNVGGSDNVFNSVSWDQTTKTAWAVGYSTNGAGTLQTLTEQWTGSSWIIVPSPNNPPGDNVLNGVAVDETTGLAHAVGYWNDASGIAHTLTEIWTGSVWKILSSPNKGIANVLTSVAWIPSTHNFWAAGYFTTPTVLQTLIIQWNGSSWNLIASPNIGANNNALNSVAALTPQAAWVVGYWTNSSGVLQTLTEQWTGSNWVIVSSPNVGPLNNVLNGVTYSTPNQNAASVGYSNTNTLAEQI